MCGTRRTEEAGTKGASNTGGSSAAGGGGGDADAGAGGGDSGMIATVGAAAGGVLALVLVIASMRTRCAKQDETANVKVASAEAPGAGAQNPADVVQDFSISFVNRAFSPAGASAGADAAETAVVTTTPGDSMYEDMGDDEGQGHAVIDEPAGPPSTASVPRAGQGSVVLHDYRYDYAVIDEPVGNGNDAVLHDYAVIDEPASNSAPNLYSKQLPYVGGVAAVQNTRPAGAGHGAVHNNAYEFDDSASEEEI